MHPAPAARRQAREQGVMVVEEETTHLPAQEAIAAAATSTHREAVQLALVVATLSRSGVTHPRQQRIHGRKGLIPRLPRSIIQLTRCNRILIIWNNSFPVESCFLRD